MAPVVLLHLHSASTTTLAAQSGFKLAAGRAGDCGFIASIFYSALIRKHRGGVREVKDTAPVSISPTPAYLSLSFFYEGTVLVYSSESLQLHGNIMQQKS